MKLQCAYLTAAILALQTIHSPAAVRYVNVNNTSPASPYISWATAATTIQDAVDAANPGDQILVTNGVYQTGSRLTSDGTQNRVVVTNSITVQAVNGPSVTTINGLNTIRCVYLSNGAVLAGFTLTSGTAANGGGLFCASTDELVSNCQLGHNSASHAGGGANGGTLNNCMLSSNSASSSGGGAYVSTLNNCTLSGNSAQYGGGAYYCMANNCTLSNNSANGNAGFTYGFGGGDYGSTLNNCTVSGNSANGVPGFYGNGFGGGSAYSMLNNCTVSGNSATGNSATGNYGPGGGAYGATLNNCVLTGNSATGTGGGADNSTLNNCTVSGNSSSGYYFQGAGAGVYGGALKNSIVYYNASPWSQNDNYVTSTINYCCTTPLPSSGAGNITSAPLFVNQSGGDYHLQASSPCVDAGNNTYIVNNTDLDGRPRIINRIVDIGAYEFQGPFNTWLQQYGLATNGAADFIDTDGDGLNNYAEWKAGTNPTNALSVLQMLPPASTNNPPGLIVSWQSVSNITYFLQSSTNLGAQPAFSTIQSNIVGQAGTTRYTDTTATNGGPYFYRVGVQ